MAMRRRRRILAAAMLAAAAGPALADYGASASLTGLTFELVDLRPDDGIAPSAKIAGGWGASSRIFGTNGCFLHCHTSRGALNKPFMASEILAGATSFASVSGAGMFASTSGKPGPNAAGQSNAFSFMSFSGTNPKFVLAPYTGLKISGTYALDAWVDAAAGAPTEFAGAHVMAWAWGQSFSTTERVRVSTDPSEGPLRANDSGQFSFTFENALDRSRGITGRLYVAASGRQVSPIPEPSTYALMAAGMFAVGIVVGRRKAAG
jgi:hypothetical protein